MRTDIANDACSLAVGMILAEATCEVGTSTGAADVIAKLTDRERASLCIGLLGAAGGMLRSEIVAVMDAREQGVVSSTYVGPAAEYLASIQRFLQLGGSMSDPEFREDENDDDDGLFLI